MEDNRDQTTVPLPAAVVVVVVDVVGGGGCCSGVIAVPKSMNNVKRTSLNTSKASEAGQGMTQDNV